ncbi:hypothetical protein BDN71DRAFT_1499327 [Pleurotus eryngii]|uniref:Uncharacterized protein n=1 Tax=Pleurotus eryngii TaxID=5323 RepID=A0A9P5ZJH0_PLEER|nr:hypothetical protein BDN71DRAFT_1499327 [Pleurotus eryngii]
MSPGRMDIAPTILTSKPARAHATASLFRDKEITWATLYCISAVPTFERGFCNVDLVAGFVYTHTAFTEVGGGIRSIVGTPAEFANEHGHEGANYSNNILVGATIADGQGNEGSERSSKSRVDDQEIIAKPGIGLVRISPQASAYYVELGLSFGTLLTSRQLSIGPMLFYRVADLPGAMALASQQCSPVDCSGVTDRYR